MLQLSPVLWCFIFDDDRAGIVPGDPIGINDKIGLWNGVDLIITTELVKEHIGTIRRIEDCKEVAMHLEQLAMGLTIEKGLGHLMPHEAWND